MSLFGMIGLGGVILYLLAYAGLQFGYLRGSGHAYTLMNMAAAGCVLISLADEFNLSSMLIQVSWITISVIGLTRRYLQNRSLHFDDRERHLASQIVPSLSGTDLRRFLNTGGWVTLNSAQKLTDQGEPVAYLYFLHKGRADVFINWTKVAEIGNENFVGEMTCLTGGAATATVVLTERSECFRIPASRLRSFIAQNPAIQEQLERSFAADLRRKLNASSELITKLSKSPDPAAQVSAAVPG